MGRSGPVAEQFRKRLRAERERRGWTQADVARMLTDNGITAYATTVAKLEGGERVVRVDELTGIADLLGVTVDRLLGRRSRPAGDLHAAVLAVLQTAQQAGWQVQSLETALLAQAAELALADSSDRYAQLVADTATAGDALATAAVALAVIGEHVDRGAVNREMQAVLDARMGSQDA